jgi:hypothetical protein
MIGIGGAIDNRTVCDVIVLRHDGQEVLAELDGFGTVGLGDNVGIDAKRIGRRFGRQAHFHVLL